MSRKQTDNAFERNREEILGKQAGLALRVIEDAKNGVCKISLSNEKRATGFFGTLDTGERVHRGLFTCNHLMDETYLKSSNCEFSIGNFTDTLKLRVKSFWFTDVDLDATFVELTDEQADKVIDMNLRFLHFNYLFKDGDKVFLLQHPRGSDLRFAFGTVDRESRDGNLFYHNCDTDDGSSGSPVTNKNGEVLGIHCGVTSNERKYAVKIQAVRKAVMEKLAPTNESEVGLKAQVQEMKQQLQHLMQLQLQDKETRRPAEKAERNASARSNQGLSRKVSDAAAQSNTQSDLIFCFGGNPTENEMLAFVPTSDKCYKLATLANKRVYAAAVNWNNTVFIAGGLECNEEWNSVEQYDPNSNTFNSMPNLLVGRYAFGLVNLNGTLYAIGGQTKNREETAEVEKLEKNTNKWQAVSPLNTARQALAASALQDCILVAGGRYGFNGISSCELYDSKLNQWSLIAPLNKVRIEAVAATYGNTVYVFGGRGAGKYHDDVEEYNRRSDKWTLLDLHMSVARDSLAAATVGNTVYLLGGSNINGDRTDVVECFDFATKKFTKRKPLPSARKEVAAVGVSVSSSALARLTK